MKDLDDLARALGVSHETKVALSRYDATLLDWSDRMNLVAKSTLSERLTRHYLDSAQLYDLIPDDSKTLVDIGSGAGFSGSSCSLFSAPSAVLRVHLVESIEKKCAFLRAAADASGAPATVHRARAEALRLPPADIVTARAVAPLKKLLEFAAPFVGETTICLFPKGRDIDVELTEAAKYWNIEAVRHPSRTDPDAAILEVRSFGRAAAS